MPWCTSKSTTPRASSLALRQSGTRGSVVEVQKPSRVSWVVTGRDARKNAFSISLHHARWRQAARRARIASRCTGYEVSGSMAYSGGAAMRSARAPSRSRGRCQRQPCRRWRQWPSRGQRVDNEGEQHFLDGIEAFGHGVSPPFCPRNRVCEIAVYHSPRVHAKSDNVGHGANKNSRRSR